MTMLWIWLSLAAPTLWAASNMIDYDLLCGRMRSPATLLVITGVSSAVPGLSMLIAGTLEWPDRSAFVLAGLSGCLGLLVYYPYFRALMISSPSRALLMWNLSPALVAVMAHAFLHEVLSTAQLVGVGLLIGSSLIAIPACALQKYSLAPYAWMSLASILLATQAVLEKALFAHASLASGIGWMSLAAGITTLIIVAIVPRSRPNVSVVVGTDTRRLVLNQLLDVSAVLCLSAATSLGPVSLVHAIGGIQPIMVLAIGVVAAGMLRVPVMRSSVQWGRTSVACGLAVVGLLILYSPK